MGFTFFSDICCCNRTAILLLLLVMVRIVDYNANKIRLCKVQTERLDTKFLQLDFLKTGRPHWGASEGRVRVLRPLGMLLRRASSAHWSSKYFLFQLLSRSLWYEHCKIYYARRSLIIVFINCFHFKHACFIFSFKIVRPILSFFLFEWYTSSVKLFHFKLTVWLNLSFYLICSSIQTCHRNQCSAVNHSNLTQFNSCPLW